MFERFPSLLVTKLFAPRLRASHVSRRQLLAALDSGADRKLILVAAAAGFGKTTLLADWSSQRGSNQHTEDIGWLSLDEGDNDLSRFLSYFIAAIQTRQPKVGQQLLAALQSPQPPPADMVLHGLINQIAAMPERLILVLDDYHVIENPAIHEALAFLLDHLPTQMTLALLTRTDPPLPLARLRSKHELLELRAALLRFSAEEAEQFLNQTMRLGLPKAAIRALDTRTEGWIAGLQLAALAMPALPDEKRNFIQEFTGSHHFILDYLISEVLSQQPEHVRLFLLRSSILQRLSGSLCSAVTGEADGQAMLDHLERNNLFLIPLDQSRTWYRYHHLFADLLQARLQAEYPEEVEELNRRAAHWHEQNGFPEDAVRYALAGKDFEYAGQLITGPASRVLHRSEVTTLLDWYKAFPPPFVHSHPRLGLHFGLAFALNGRWDEVETLVGHADIPQDTDDLTDLPPEVLALSYLGARDRFDPARVAALVTEAATNLQFDPVTQMMLAMLVSVSGDLRLASQLMEQVQQASEREGDMALAFTALFHRCRFEVYLGDFQGAYKLCQEALKRSQEQGGAALSTATLAHLALGRILIEWNDLDSAERHLTEGLRIAEMTGFLTGIVSSGTMMLAETKQGQGDSQGADQAANDAIAAAERNDPASEVDWLKVYQARVWLTQGNVAAAVDWLRTAPNLKDTQATSIFYPTHILPITQARVLLAQRKSDEATALLTGLAENQHNLLTVEALAVLALVRQAQGDSVHALMTFEQALKLAEPENRIRAFLDLGQPMAKLLGRFCETQPGHSFAQKLLGLFAGGIRAPEAIDSLSDRELEVLRLIVAGNTNEEIAHKLTIAVSTVKWYVNTLYGKLHVKTRGQAIARAHDLRLT